MDLSEGLLNHYMPWNVSVLLLAFMPMKRHVEDSDLLKFV